MKILCLCRKGNSRSVALAWLLKEEMGHEAIAVGTHEAGKDTIKMLCDWAELIILVAGERHRRFISRKYWNKLIVWDVGPDVFFRGFDEGLIKMFNKYIKNESALYGTPGK